MFTLDTWGQMSVTRDYRAATDGLVIQLEGETVPWA